MYCSSSLKSVSRSKAYIFYSGLPIHVCFCVESNESHDSEEMLERKGKSAPAGSRTQENLSPNAGFQQPKPTNQAGTICQFFLSFQLFFQVVTFIRLNTVTTDSFILRNCAKRSTSQHHWCSEVYFSHACKPACPFMAFSLHAWMSIDVVHWTVII